MFWDLLKSLKNAIFGDDSSTKSVTAGRTYHDVPSRDFGHLSLSSTRSSPSPYISTTIERTDTSSKNLEIRGIVYKMDLVNQRALIRVIIDQDQCHAMYMPSTRYRAVNIQHLFIPFSSNETGVNDIELGSIVKVLEYEGRRLSLGVDGAMNFTREAPAKVTKYEVDHSTTTRKENELVAVTKIKDNYLAVVGSAYGSSEGIISYPKNVNPNQWKNLTRHTFLYGELINLPKYYKVILNNENPELIYDHEARVASIKLHETSGNVRLASKAEPTTGPPFITRIRQLTNVETETIRQQTRNWTSINYQMAVQYIRDPLLTCAALEDYEAKQSVKQFTCQVSNLISSSDKVTRRDCIYVPVTERVNECLTDRGRDTWQLGSDLVLSSEMLGRNGISVVLDGTNYESAGTKYIRLVGVAGSEHVFNAINNHTGNLNWAKLIFKLGPMDSESNSNAEAIRDGFQDFFHGRYDLFNDFIGRSKAFNIADVPNSNKEFYIGGQKMDVSQRLAMRTAIGVPGFTCVSAPPGSGKTFMISGIVGAKLEEDEDARFAITATTNIAVTNAIEAVYSKFPNERIIRKFSRKSEAELGKDAPILALSLARMTRNERIIRSLMVNADFARAISRRNQAQLKMKTKAQNVAEQLSYVSEYNRAETAVGAEFIRCYSPRIFGSTGSIMARSEHEEISHLIIDEATQMSQVDALSLYCRLPDLDYVTLIGDSRQLGPFTALEEGSLAYEIMHKGELTRLEELRSSAKRELQYIYRSHPRIIDLLLKPIYGNQLKAGTPASARNLAAETKLPVAKDGSPCLFVQVDGQETGGRNEKEAKVVLAFLDYLKSKKIKPEDVNIICHHRAQKDSLCEALKDKGNVGRLNLMYGVNTVDSYQGKEAKIVLILTTKTCETKKLEILQKTFSFISDANRETVAVSRAQHAVYIFGNWKQLAIMPFWNQFGTGLINSGAIVNEQWQHISEHGWMKNQPKAQKEKNTKKTSGDKPKNKKRNRQRGRSTANSNQ